MPSKATNIHRPAEQIQSTNKEKERLLLGVVSRLPTDSDFRLTEGHKQTDSETDSETESETDSEAESETDRQ